MGLESQLDKVPVRLRKRYLASYNEIEVFRRLGRELREKVRQNPVRHGHLITRELHNVEYEVLKVLCPDIKAPDAKIRQKALYWVCNQDWGKDLRASPYDKRYF